MVTPTFPASVIQRVKGLTDDVGSLCVVCELVLSLVFTVLVERALVAGLQNALQKLQLTQAGTQAVDPQSLLVALDGPTDVCFACGPKNSTFSSQTRHKQTPVSAVLALTDALTLILLFQNVQRRASLGKVVVHL